MQELSDASFVNRWVRLNVYRLKKRCRVFNKGAMLKNLHLFVGSVVWMHMAESVATNLDGCGRNPTPRSRAALAATDSLVSSTSSFPANCCSFISVSAAFTRRRMTNTKGKSLSFALALVPAVASALLNYGVASPKFGEGLNILTWSEQHYFVWETTSQSIKRQKILKIWGLMAPLASHGCTYGTKKWLIFWSR